MKRLVALIGMLAIAGTMSVSLSAQARGTTPRSDARTTDQSSVREEIARLRALLEKLKAELKEKEQQLREARQAGNRQLAARIMQQIKKLKDEIARIERRIRQLLAGRDR